MRRTTAAKKLADAFKLNLEELSNELGCTRQYMFYTEKEKKIDLFKFKCFVIALKELNEKQYKNDLEKAKKDKEEREKAIAEWESIFR